MLSQRPALSLPRGERPLSFLSDLNTPLAMVVIGTQLAEAHLPSTFRQPRNYLVSFLRLALFPTLTALLLAPPPLLLRPLLRPGAIVRHACGRYDQPLCSAVRPGYRPCGGVHHPVNSALHPHPAPSSPCWPEGSACSNRKRRRGRPRWGGRVSICAKTSCAPAFVCVRGAPVAHEVLFLFNTPLYTPLPRGGKAANFLPGGPGVSPALPACQGPISEKPVSHRPVFFCFRPHFPLDFFSIYLT